MKKHLLKKTMNLRSPGEKMYSFKSCQRQESMKVTVTHSLLTLQTSTWTTTATSRRQNLKLLLKHGTLKSSTEEETEEEMEEETEETEELTEVNP